MSLIYLTPLTFYHNSQEDSVHTFNILLRNLLTYIPKLITHKFFPHNTGTQFNQVFPLHKNNSISGGGIKRLWCLSWKAIRHERILSNLWSVSFFVLFGLHPIGSGPPTRAICFPQSMDFNVDLIKKHSHRNNQNIWALQQTTQVNT